MWPVSWQIPESIKLTCIALLALAAVAGCASAPVQEMSNARQAIGAAQAVQAEEYAPERLKSAERLLGRAERELDAGRYGKARRHAQAAWEEAVEARSLAIANSAP